MLDYHLADKIVEHVQPELPRFIEPVKEQVHGVLPKPRLLRPDADVDSVEGAPGPGAPRLPSPARP